MINRVLQRLIRHLPPGLSLRSLTTLSLLNGAVDPEMKHLKRFLPKDRRQIALDVGANNGVTASLLARTFAHVYAFEPNPQLISSWRSVIAKNVASFELAVSNTCQDTVLKIPVVKGLALSGWASLDTPNVGEAQLLEVPVRCMSLDHFCTEQGLKRVDFIKIDVEGHELSVLEGATNLVQSWRPWILAEANENKDALIKYLTPFNYSAISAANRQDIGLSDFSTQNVLFVPDKK